MMVALLIAMVVAALGYVAYKRRIMATGAGPVKVPDTYEQYGGTDFLVKPGTDSQHAAAAGATAYDPKDPATAQRTLDAIARADKMTALASSQGMTVNQVFAKRTAESVATGQLQAKSIAVFSAAHGGFTPSTNADLYQAESAQTPLMTNQPPGTYWDYATQSWAPLLF